MWKSCNNDQKSHFFVSLEVCGKVASDLWIGGGVPLISGFFQHLQTDSHDLAEILKKR